jgi:hypothetical protein
MASVRSISSSKPPEQHLSTRRVNRTSTSTPPIAQKQKISINKTTSTSKQKSSRMPLKKGSTGSDRSSTKFNSSNTVTSLQTFDITTDQMASIKLQDFPSNRSRSRIPDTTNNSNSQVNHIDEQQYDTNETIPSSLSNHQFTLESFQTIRTVGTGKNFF